VQVTADIRLYIASQLSKSIQLRAWLADHEADLLANLCDGLFIVALFSSCILVNLPLKVFLMSPTSRYLSSSPAEVQPRIECILHSGRGTLARC